MTEDIMHLLAAVLDQVVLQSSTHRHNKVDMALGESPSALE